MAALDYTLISHHKGKTSDRNSWLMIWKENGRTKFDNKWLPLLKELFESMKSKA